MRIVAGPVIILVDLNLRFLPDHLGNFNLRGQIFLSLNDSGILLDGLDSLLNCSELLISVDDVVSDQASFQIIVLLGGENSAVLNVQRGWGLL